MSLPEIVSQYGPIGILAGSIATAVATTALWGVTRGLSRETRRMADAAARPQIVATLDPNQWSLMHLDLNLSNTGNATAFDIEVTFDPPLEVDGDLKSKDAVPFQKVSILKSGQSLNSYLNTVQPLREIKFTITTKWALVPGGPKEELRYMLDMSQFKGVSHLGSRNPTVQLAEQVKNLREDWRGVARGSTKLKIDSFDQSDRDKEREAWEARRKEREAARRADAKDK